jgi:hypothetical protein
VLKDVARYGTLNTPAEKIGMDNVSGVDPERTCELLCTDVLNALRLCGEEARIFPRVRAEYVKSGAETGAGNERNHWRVLPQLREVPCLAQCSALDHRSRVTFLKNALGILIQPSIDKFESR